MFPERNDSRILILDGKEIFFDKKFRSTNYSAFNINHIFFRSLVMFPHLNIQSLCIYYRFESLRRVLWPDSVYSFDPSHNSIHLKVLSLNAFCNRVQEQRSSHAPNQQQTNCFVCVVDIYLFFKTILQTNDSYESLLMVKKNQCNRLKWFLTYWCYLSMLCCI